MNNRFFKQTITIFQFDKKNQSFNKYVIKNVYFRYEEKTQMTDNGLIKVSGGSITIPSEYALFNNQKAVDLYNIEWFVNSKSYIMEGQTVYTDYSEIMKKCNAMRVTSVQDNRKGNLQHIKIEVEK